MTKRISIIGSTGSIGTQALDIIRNRNSGKDSPDFEVVALSAGRNLERLIDQIKEFRPQYISILNKEDQDTIKELFPEINSILGRSSILVKAFVKLILEKFKPVLESVILSPVSIKIVLISSGLSMLPFSSLLKFLNKSAAPAT